MRYKRKIYYRTLTGQYYGYTRYYKGSINPKFINSYSLSDKGFNWRVTDEI